jgi:hypothetical protein
MEEGKRGEDGGKEAVNDGGNGGRKNGRTNE